MIIFYRGFIALAALVFLASSTFADEIQAEGGNADQPDFDIVQTDVTREDSWLVFTMKVEGQGGATKPAPTGALAGSGVFAYVWPTTITASEIGFEHALTKKGILAFAVTAHPDFDDTPCSTKTPTAISPTMATIGIAIGLSWCLITPAGKAH